jgi:peptide/nickel transport system permease protein
MRRVIWERLGRNKLAISGGIIVLIMFGVALFAPVLAPYDPNAIDRLRILSSPDPHHLLGTDDLGRDVLSRMIYGARVSLLVGFVAVGISAIVGIIFGALAGYYGGIMDILIMRFIDIMLAVPTFFLILAVIAFIGPGIWSIMIIIGLTSWMGIARFIRAEFLSLRYREFILSAESIGSSVSRIIIRHMLPNSLAPVLVSAVLGVAAAVLVESSLSFLGLGVQPPDASWGNILTLGKSNIEIAWWLSVYPGLAILITVLGYNLLGEGLRDALDPRIWENR